MNLFYEFRNEFSWKLSIVEHIAQVIIISSEIPLTRRCDMKLEKIFSTLIFKAHLRYLGFRYHVDTTKLGN